MQIKLTDLCYSYNQKTPMAHLALDRINLEIEDHSFLALVGETGSGKSTLVQHLNGLLWPTSGTLNIGEFFIDGNNRKLQKKKKKGIRELRSYAGLVFQFPEYQLFERTVLRDVAFGPKNFGRKEDDAIAIAKESLSLVGIDESYYERSPFGLSGGEKRRIAIAGIIALKPKVLVLDEPTAGLDPRGEKEMMELFTKIYDSGTSIILVTHNMDIVLKYAKSVVVMDKAEVVTHETPLELFQNSEILDKVAIEPPYVFRVAVELNKSGFNIDLSKVKDLETLAAEIARNKGVRG